MDFFIYHSDKISNNIIKSKINDNNLYILGKIKEPANDGNHHQQVLYIIFRKPILNDSNKF
jgi:hypothetical protein